MIRSHAEIDEHGRRQDARLEVGADRDDGRAEVGRSELAHRDGIGRVRLDDVCQRPRVVLDLLRVGIRAEHLVAEHGELDRERPAEAAEPADEELVLPSQ